MDIQALHNANYSYTTALNSMKIIKPPTDHRTVSKCPYCSIHHGPHPRLILHLLYSHRSTRCTGSVNHYARVCAATVIQGKGFLDSTGSRRESVGERGEDVSSDRTAFYMFHLHLHLRCTMNSISIISFPFILEVGFVV